MMENLKTKKFGSITENIGDFKKIYVVGDVHGMADIFMDVVFNIEVDIANSGEDDYHIVLLGDLIDRGPKNIAVLDVVKGMKINHADRITVLPGNHDLMAAEAFRIHAGRDAYLDYMDRNMLDLWTMNGGYKVIVEFNESPENKEKFLDYLESVNTAPNYVQFGDYIFVHAGIPMYWNEREALEQDKYGATSGDRSDYHWAWTRAHMNKGTKIDAWLGDPNLVVVHGHTITANNPYMDDLFMLADCNRLHTTKTLKLDAGSYYNHQIVWAKIESDGITLHASIDVDKALANDDE